MLGNVVDETLLERSEGFGISINVGEGEVDASADSTAGRQHRRGCFEEGADVVFANPRCELEVHIVQQRLFKD